MWSSALRCVGSLIRLGLTLWILCPVAAHAQDAVSENPSAGPGSPSEAPDAPPRALSVPSIEWPMGLAVPEDLGLTVLLLIGQDGLAQVSTCDLDPRICDAISAALLEARFEPARVKGKPSAARVQVRFGVRATPALPEPESEPQAEPTPNTQEEDDFELGARALVERDRPTAIALELEEMREVPGTFGDPFRVIDALPGVLPITTGLPYVYVRGAPPAATAYFYDDIQLPALFHLALGPAVVHAAMVGPIDFYPGVAPARYGRKTGGVVAGKAAFRPLKPGLHGEVELRLIDTQLYLSKPLAGGGRVEVAGRYGYPGLLIKLAESKAVFQYWDYQLRAVTPLSKHSEATLVALGSFDLVGERKNGSIDRQLELQFHRVEARVVTQRGQRQIGSALSTGFERSGLGNDLNVQALRIGPKVWVETPLYAGRLRIGADMLATTGKIDDGIERSDEEESDIGLSNNPIYRSATGRNVVGAHTELIYPFAERWEIEAGARTDLWITGGDVQAAFEPRLLLRFDPREGLSTHAAFGLAYQPAVFLIPLPGISDVALDRGLQRAIQTELGASLELPASFSIDTKLFAHFYDGMLSIDAIDDGDVECDPELEQCKENDSFARLNAYAYGSEWMIRRAYKERFSGWLAYTLSKADGRTDGGKDITPNFDVRHVSNLVLQWRITKHWHIAMRGYAQSGRFPFAASTATDPRERRRLPPFVRGDLQLARIWPRSWGELRFTFDWLNFTLQREPLGWNCPDPAVSSSCKVEYTEFPVTLPMLGVRGTF